MKVIWMVFGAVPVAVAFAACGEDVEDVFGPAPVMDAGQEADAATVDVGDAAKDDGGKTVEAGSDAGDADEDAADASDSGPLPFLSCIGLTPGHLVIKVIAPADKPAGTRNAADGWLAYQGKDLLNPSWRGLYIAPTTEFQTAADLSAQPIGPSGAFLGPVKSGAKMEFNPGYNASANLAANPVVDSGYQCQNGVCQGSILVCHGEVEIGRTVEGVISGSLKVMGETGANIVITVP